MKKYAFIAILMLALFSGCKQDFDLTADYKETPIVYGLLNQQDAVHYIRIQKGYLIDGNAQIAAGITDSIYYPDVLTVKLVPFLNGNPSGTPFTLQRVTNTTMLKDSGIFAYDPNVLYSFTGNLDPNRTYQLQVTNTTNGYTFSSQRQAGKTFTDGGINLISDFQIINPSIRGQHINITNNIPYKIIWSAAGNASLYDVKVRFPYKEYDLTTNTLLKDTFVDVYMVKSKDGEGISSGSSVYDEFNLTILLNSLKNALNPNNETQNVYREFNEKVGMTFYVSAGGPELSRYIYVTGAQQASISSNEALPSYTNIKGGYGLFSSRYSKQMDSILIDGKGLDSIACSPLTSGLNFHKANGTSCQ